MTPNVQQPSAHPRWEAFKSSFKQSNYITDFWNWFMTLMSKAAEMVLFGTVLYSGYQLLPGVPHVPAPIDAAVFVIQQGSLDIGGMGLLKLAKRAGLPRDAFPVRLGAALVVLMILNVALASIKHTFPMIAGGVFVGIETVLLIARAVVAVLFGHAIYALREEYGESTITLKEASELQQCMDELSSKLVRVQQDFHRQLSSTLAPVHESFQQYQEALSQVPMLKAHLQHLESSTVEEIDRVKAFLEKQLQGYVAEREKQTERPVLHALPPSSRTPTRPGRSTQNRCIHALHKPQQGSSTPAPSSSRACKSILT